MKFCVYQTTYLGAKLPPFYIGSTSVDKIMSGKYFGSVKSKRYKDIWREELKHNRQLFTTEILSEHNTREEALSAELQLQLKHNVVKNELYINLSLASVNGYFGMDTSGVNHPQFGLNHSEETKQKHSASKSKLFSGEGNPNYGVSASQETKKKMSEKKKLIYQGSGHPQFKYTEEIQILILQFRIDKRLLFREIKDELQALGFSVSTSHIGKIYRGLNVKKDNT
jgi:hypothetical protein